MHYNIIVEHQEVGWGGIIEIIRLRIGAVGGLF